MNLVRLLSLEGRGDLNLRVDLRVRDKFGRPIYDKGAIGRPLPGTLQSVAVVRARARGRKYLEWRYEPDAGVDVPSATPGYARVVLGPTVGNYYLMALPAADESPSAPPSQAS